MLGTSMANARRRRMLFLRGERLGNVDHVELPGDSLPTEQSFDPAGQFFSICGGRPPLKILVTDDDTEEQTELQVHQPFAVVGRSDLCHVQLPDEAVSRRHAYLQVIDGRVFCCDLKSRNGTYWNGERKRLGWLGGSGRLQIGPYSIALPEADCEQSSEDLPGRLPTLRDDREQFELTTPAPSLEFLNARHGENLWEINRDITFIGRGTGCKLQLDDDSISAIHAALVRTPTALWVIDLLGQGGTFVDGKRVGFAELREGQELRIGKFRFRVRLAQLQSAPAWPAHSPADSGETAALRRLEKTMLANSRPIGLAPTQPLTDGQSALTPNREGEADGGGSGERLTEQFVLSIVRQFAECQADTIRQTQATIRAVLNALNNVHENQRLLVEDVVRRLRSRGEADDGPSDA